ncbi:MAG: hypothetical protein K1X74_09985 [Pirellulales bacterium]|nr:hypothetical protein [Pirellulales bacterium]
MPAIFDRHGLHFLYPEDWTVEDNSDEAQASVTVYSPDGWYWSVNAFGKDADRDVLVEEAVRAFQSEYQGVDTYPVHEQIAERDLTGFDLDFIYLDLITRALIRAVRHGDQTLVIVCQAEDRQLARLEPVFRAMTTSLLQSDT